MTFREEIDKHSVMHWPFHSHSRRLFVDRADHWVVQLIRASAASLGAALGDYALLVVAVEVWNTPVVWTSAAGVVFGHVISFILHTLWIFPGADHGYHKTQMVLFVAIGASGLLLHSGLMYMFERFSPLHYLIAKTVSVLVMFLWGFLLRRTSHRRLKSHVPARTSPVPQDSAF